MRVGGDLRIEIVIDVEGITVDLMPEIDPGMGKLMREEGTAADEG